nr:chaperone protein DnaJ [Marseillevirus cajuinensis]
MEGLWEDERSPWEVLGVEEGAEQPQIKKAYHRAALRLHPDRNPEKDTTEEFLLVRKAYEILSSKNLFHSPAPGLDLHASVATLFSNVLMIRSFHLVLQLEDVWSCQEREFLLEDEGPCFVCLGVGRRTPNILCRDCFGFSRMTGEDCGNCFGNGFRCQKERTCEFCLGKGKARVERRLCLELGPHLKGTQKYTLSSCLSVCEISVEEHPIYKRRGELDLEIFLDIVEGKTNTFDLEFLGGERLKFFSNRQQSKKGKTLLLRGRGLRTSQGKRGNIYVHLK